MLNYIIGTPRHISGLGIRAWYDSSLMATRLPDLQVTKSLTAVVSCISENSWHLEIPANASRSYRLAQLDDHGSLPRKDFPWQPSCRLNLQARVSAQQIPGTWGFGLWNEPFNFLLSNSRLVPRLPALPDTAWFFHASPQNYLSFKDDLPASGFLAATFSSQRVPFALLALASPALLLTLLPRTTQVVRRLLRRVIRQDASLIRTDVTEWHEYNLEWTTGHTRFSLDGMEILRTDITPCGPLSLVVWIDNQFAAMPPNRRLRYGTLPNPEPAWMEIRGLSLSESG
jgi:hypothetical protein